MRTAALVLLSGPRSPPANGVGCAARGSTPQVTGIMEVQRGITMERTAANITGRRNCLSRGHRVDRPRCSLMATWRSGSPLAPRMARRCRIYATSFTSWPPGPVP